MGNHLETTINAARSAGQIILNDFTTSVSHENKGSHDIVTATDLKAEAEIIGQLSGEYPTYSIHSEEAGSLDKSSEYCWIIDPLDGTSNFRTGNPYFSVSIALVQKNMVILGVIFNPVSNELFHAEKGQGAFLNGGRIKVSDKSSLADAFIAAAFSADEKDIREGIGVINTLALKCRRVVINFAPALDLCNIARGRVDALVDNGSTPEDHAAASLILSEAGGTVANYFESGWDFMKTGIIAGNSKIEKELNHLLSGNNT